MTPTLRYPVGPITPHGQYHLLRDIIPQVALRAYDDSTVFHMMGALAIPERGAPERVLLQEVRGLVPPWQTIDQKGASQDGVTFVDALYDPIEVELTVEATGRNPDYLRRVVSDLIASIDAKKESELSWFTQRMGIWWAPVRWYKTPDSPLAAISTSRQKLTLRLRADDGFWRTYPDVAQLRHGSTTVLDDFLTDSNPGDPITGWTIAYAGGGSGYLYVDNGEVVSTLASGRRAVARNDGFTASGDNVSAGVNIGTLPQWNWPTNGYIDVWARMNNTGTPGTDGIRMRIGSTSVTVSSFVNGSETVIKQKDHEQFGRANETITLVAGVGNDLRSYRVVRNGATMLSAKETGTTSLVNSSHRKAGFGQYVASGSVRPPAVRAFAAGDENTGAMSGWLTRYNIGDQPMWDTYTCFGPGTFLIGNGPGSTDMVSFGPLLANQVMQIRADPRKRGVVDLTAIPPSPQELAFWQEAMAALLSFFSFGPLPPLFVTIESLFGIRPPQGNPYSLLHGRFSVPIPAKSPGNPAQPYYIKAEIQGGNADSQIIASGTPLRRWPL